MPGEVSHDMLGGGNHLFVHLCAPDDSKAAGLLTRGMCLMHACVRAVLAGRLITPRLAVVSCICSLSKPHQGCRPFGLFKSR
jgi:hypothetical protein